MSKQPDIYGHGPTYGQNDDAVCLRAENEKLRAEVAEAKAILEEVYDEMSGPGLYDEPIIIRVRDYLGIPPLRRR